MEVRFSTPPAARQEPRRGNVAFCIDSREMPAALLAALVLQVTDETMAELDRAYDQTCNARLYGQYDGMCNEMAERLKSYRAELRRRPKPPTAPGPSAAAATAPPVAPSETPPSHDRVAPTPPKG